jgi:hypothetical protein
MTAATNTTAGAMLQPALTLAAAGWRILPCWDHDDDAREIRAKSPIGPLVPAGKDNATTDPDVITGWWRRYPPALVGAVVPAHLLVLDVDPWHGGTLASLEHAAGGRLPSTLTTWSGRGDGGCHLYYGAPAGDLTGTNLPAGVDLRKGGRHYLIMPPSRHPVTGNAYRWEQHPVVPAPAHLVDLLTPRSAPRLPWSPPAAVTDRRVRAWLAKVAGAAEGNRDNALFWAACRAAEAGVLDQVADQLADAAAGTGLPEREIRATLRSAGRRSA